jgi:hypothetical protein
MPPYDPRNDASLAWAIVRVRSIEPARPTNGQPGRVQLVVEAVLRGEVPASLEVLFGPPREVQQERFYVDRGNGLPPWDEATRARSRAAHADIDARPVEVPEVGARIAVWLSRDLGHWDIPTLRSLGQITFPMRSRWVEEAHLPALRQRLGPR